MDEQSITDRQADTIGHDRESDRGSRDLVTTSCGLSPTSGGNLFSDRPSQSVHNFIGTPQEQWRLTARACGECLGFDDLDPDQAISVKYIYCHEVEITKDGGEVAPCIRTVLIEPDGRCFAFVSDGVAMDAWRMLQTFQGRPIEPPEKMIVKRIRTRRGFNTYCLVPA